MVKICRENFQIKGDWFWWLVVLLMLFLMVIGVFYYKINQVSNKGEVEYQYEIREVGDEYVTKRVFFKDRISEIVFKDGNYYLLVDFKGLSLKLALGDKSRKMSVFVEPNRLEARTVEEAVSILQERRDKPVGFVLPVSNKEMYKKIAEDERCKKRCQDKLDLTFDYLRENKILLEILKSGGLYKRTLEVGPVITLDLYP